MDSIAFVSSWRCPGITARLRTVAENLPAEVAIAASSLPQERGEATARANDLVLVDGHWTGPGCVDGLGLGLRKACPGIKARIVIVGCCYSGESEFTDAVRGGLNRQVAYLGYTGQAPRDHGEIVFLPVLRALLQAGLPTSVDAAASVINRSLEKLCAERPRKKSLASWHAAVLGP
jgi:hypothetical protein